MSLKYPCVHFVDGMCKKFSDEKVTSYCMESPCEYQELSNADRIRAMSDEELANVMYDGINIEYCSNAPECNKMLDEPNGIPKEKCIGCALKWLKQPAGDENE